MTRWVEEIMRERRSKLARREIEAAVDEVQAGGPDRQARREWYRELLQRASQRRPMENGK